jgi:hypothetical protein
MFWEVRETIPDFDQWISEGRTELLIDRKILQFIYSELEAMGSIDREAPDHRTVTLETTLDVSTVDFGNGRSEEHTSVL